jgi:uncharacterized protein YprB with RNaseH-like and TPR domain
MTNQKEQLINYLSSKVNRTETWYELACKFNIGEGLTKEQRSKKANDLWRRFIKRGLKAVTADKKNPRLMYLDIETSPNIGFFWQSGYKLNIGYENIIHERAVICICWKWQGEDKVHSLHWNNGCDKELLKNFVEELDKADLVVGHNIQRFDLPWIFGRCVKHKISIDTSFKKEDTLTMARNMFKFNSNRLDYIANYLGVGGKTSTSYDLWKDIVLKNDKKAMKTIIEYCCNDVEILEKVHKRLCQYKKKK